MATPRTPKGRSATPKPTACIAPNCGQPLFGGPPFCAYCGASQAKPEPVESPPPPPPPPPPPSTPPPAPAPPPAPPSPAASPPPAKEGPWSAAAPSTPAAATGGPAKPSKPAAPRAAKPAPPKPPPQVMEARVGMQPIAGLPRDDKKKKNNGCGCLLIGLGVAFLLIVILAALGGESSDAETLYVNRGVSVRAQADARGNAPVDAMVRGTEVKGEWVTETGGTERWLKLTEGPYKDHYLWGRNLSTQRRPVLTTRLDERRRVSELTVLREEPSKTARRLQTLPAKTRVALVGQTETGWWEVIRSQGGVGYLEPEAFSQGAAEPLAAPAAETPVATDGAGSPSFDCRAVRNLVKKAICADAQLSRADRELADLYEEALVKAADPAAVRTEQRAWIRRRDAGSTATSHLAQLYERRAAELRQTRRPAPAPARPAAPRQTTTTTVTVTSRDWIRRPSADDFARYFPERAARSGVDGRVVLNCTVTQLGYLSDCRVLAESPSGYEFGNAALRLSRLYRMRAATVDGMPAAGGKVRLQISFTLPR